MDKKVKFSENPAASKVVYAIVVAILAVTAIVIGIVSAASQKDEAPTPDTNNGTTVTPGENDNNGDNNGGEDKKEPEKELTFVSPTVGTVAKEHSMEMPVFSLTLGEWRVHTGIDICTEEGSEVFSSADGTVSDVREDPMLGLTVEVTHKNGIKTVYSNLAKDGSIAVSIGDELKQGDLIGTVGDSAMSELADEAHLHFEILVNDVSVNPLDYFTESSKSTSLGIGA